MKKIIISILEDGQDAQERAQRAAQLEQELKQSAPTCQVETVYAGPQVVFALLKRDPDAVIAVGYGPKEIGVMRSLIRPVIWDMYLLDRAQIEPVLASEDGMREMQRALAATNSCLDISEDLALLIEDELKVGLSSHDLPAALAAAAKNTVVIIGAGLGNMIYATPMIRWLSERLNAPVDVIIHDRFDVAVPLFARAEWINRVYPGFEYVTGRRYRLGVSSITAGGYRPPFTAEKMLWVDEQRDYNIEGRFIHETRLNFIDLEAEFDDVPSLMEAIPAPFIRDVTYEHPKGRIVGVASGQKDGSWSNREWPHMQALVDRLLADGWQVRSFGLPDEHLPGAENCTGLPMREALERMAECSYFISYDGGVCHMAEGIGVPTIWLFGSTSLVKNGPYYAHSPALLSRRECGPCLYKADWIRCTDAACMGDITIDQVVATLENMKTQIDTEGYAPQQAAEHTDLLPYEAEALLRPGPDNTLSRRVNERLSLAGWSDATLEYLGLRLLQAGDLVGLSAITDGLRYRYPDSVLGRVLSAIAAQAFPGPSILQDVAGPRPQTITPEDMAALPQALSRTDFSAEHKRTLMVAMLRCLLGNQDRASAGLLLEHLAPVEPFSTKYARLLRSLRHLVDSDSAIDPTDFLDTVNMRMRTIQSSPLESLLEQYAPRLSDPLDVGIETVLDTAFTPHLETVKSGQKELIPVPLQIGTHETVLRHHSPVLILVPHVKVKHAYVGSTSNLIRQQAERLAMIGLRPIVVTMGYDDIVEGWTMRDSITFIQGHPDWSSENWEKLREVFKPDLVLAYGGVEQGLSLPASYDGLVPLSLAGLMDPDGLLREAPAGDSWSPCPSPQLPNAQSADALGAALFVEPDAQPARPAAPISVVVLMPDARDFVPFITVATALPSVTFHVMTPLRHRGIEKNIRMVQPGDLSAQDRANAQLFMQFSTRQAALSAEAITWMEGGRRVLAAADGSTLPDAWLNRITQADAPGAWVHAIQSEATRLKQRALHLLSD